MKGMTVSRPLPATHISIEKLSPRHLASAVNVIASAFQANPLADAIFTEIAPENRLLPLTRLFAPVVLTAQRYGLVYVVRRAGQVVGVSVTYPPDKYPLSTTAALFKNLGSYSLRPRYSLRYRRYASYLTENAYNERHWFHYLLGVRKECQGAGIGEALVKHLCRLADADQTPSYLQTEVPKQVAFYEKHGYEVLSEGTVPGLESLKMWNMRRMPQKKTR